MCVSKTNAPKTLTVLLAATAMVTALAGPAFAEKRGAAPIVYAGQSQATSSYAPRARAAAKPQSKASRRIEFRYPDQPQTFYGKGGARSAQGSAPMAFSSAKSAIAPAQARQYASVQAPAVTSPAVVADPAISSGGFDARAAAARVQNTRNNVQPVQSAPLAPLPRRDATVAGQGSAYPADTKLASMPGQAFTVEPESAPMFDETGLSIVYGEEFEGLPTANGEIFSQAGMTAAHPTMPLPSLVQVVHMETGREVVVRVNDRGPFEDGAGFQVSKRAADVLGFGGAGRANVRVRYLGPAPVEADTLAGAEQMVSTPKGLEGYSVSSVAQAAPAPVMRAQVPQPAMQTVNYEAPTAGFFVQVGSFADMRNAMDMQASLTGGMPVEIQQARVNGADYFRVRVGPVDSRSTASDLRDHLATQGIADGRVVSAD